MDFVLLLLDDSAIDVLTTNTNNREAIDDIDVMLHGKLGGGL